MIFVLIFGYIFIHITAWGREQEFRNRKTKIRLSSDTNEKSNWSVSKVIPVGNKQFELQFNMI